MHYYMHAAVHIFATSILRIDDDNRKLVGCRPISHIIVYE